MRPKAFIVYISPAGSTRHAASVIEHQLRLLGADVGTLDLKSQEKWPEFQNRIASTESNTCLFAGSPVYRGQAVPPVLSFIRGLGLVRQKYAVPFATWGGSSSGSALWQMGAALKEKGFSIAAAVKVMGFHSVMFNAKDPLCAALPGKSD